MNSFGRRLAAVTMTGMATLGAVATSVSPASAAPPQPNACDNAFWMPPVGSLNMTTDPAAGTSVLAGDAIQIDATWNTADWLDVSPTGTPMGLYQEIACASLNGTVINEIGDQNLDPPNDGSYSTTIVVPQAAQPGDELCVRVRISGHPPAQSPQTQKTETACFTVGSALQNVDPGVERAEEPDPELDESQTQQSPPLVDSSSEEPSTALPVVVTPVVEGSPSPAPRVAPVAIAELPRTGTAPLAMVASGLSLILIGGAARFVGRHGRRS